MAIATETQWQKIRLGSLGEFKNGVNFGKEKMGEGVRLINVKDIFSSGRAIDFDSLDKVNLADQKNIGNYFVKEGDLFFVRSSVKREGVGLVSMAQRTNNDTVHCGFVIRFRPTSPDIDSLFLTYLLRAPYYREVIRGLSSGVAITNISQDSLGSLTINLPPLPTQRRIASILSAYDDLIENNTRRIKLLEQMAQAIYREWFVEFRAPGVRLRKATSNEQKVTGKDRFPVGWEIKPLDDVVEEIIDYRGKTPKKLGSEWSDSGVMAVSALNVKQGRLVNLEKSKFVDEDLYRKWMKSELRQGDILMTSEAPLGELYYLSDKKRLCLSQRLFSIRADAALLAPVLLYMGLSSPTTQKEIHGRSSGTTVLGIRQAELRKVPVLLPAKIVQDKVSPVLDDFLAAIETLQAKNANLRQTRDLLLPRLVGGEIRIEPSADEGTD